jgi:hypothetical protein
MLYLFIRFCIGKSLLANFKNIFVIRQFLYIIFYLICLLPIKINAFVILIYEPKELIFDDKLSILFNVTLGFVMFLIRASETNFYVYLFCKHKNNSHLLNQSEFEKGEEKDKEQKEFFEKGEPLTSVISLNMNLEFMCCILYGLSYIFKPKKKKQSVDTIDLTVRMSPDDIDGTLTLQQHTYNQTLLNEHNTKEVFKNVEFYREKTHKIIYKKIFYENINFEDIGFKVTVRRNTAKKENPLDTSCYTESDLQSIATKDEKQDAQVIEHCPRVFRELRKLDEITGEELEK